jgi:hypothetical protein
MAQKLSELATTTESTSDLVNEDDQCALTPDEAMELVHGVHSRPLYRFLLDGSMDRDASCRSCAARVAGTAHARSLLMELGDLA